MNVLHTQFLDILGKGKQMTEREEEGSEKKVGGWTGGCGM